MKFTSRAIREIVLSVDRLSAVIVFEGETAGTVAEVAIPSDQLHHLLTLSASAGGQAEPVLGLETVVPISQLGIGSLSGAGCVIAAILPDGMPLRFVVPWPVAVRAARMIQNEADDHSPPVHN